LQNFSTYSTIVVIEEPFGVQLGSSRSRNQQPQWEQLATTGSSHCNGEQLLQPVIWCICGTIDLEAETGSSRQNRIRKSQSWFVRKGSSPESEFTIHNTV